MCNIFKCNRAGKYIGYYNNLSEAVYHNPNPQRDWFFTNGETLSVWMFNGFNWVDANRGSSSSCGFEIIDEPATFIPSVVIGEVKTYFYIASEAGVYNFQNFGGGIILRVEYPCLIQLEWTGNSWDKYTYKITDPIKKQEYTLPNIELRFVSYPKEYDEPSDIYGSKEGNIIRDCMVEFRITESLDYINENKESIYVCLNRWKSKKKRGSLKTKGWKVVVDQFTVSDLANSYPNGASTSTGFYDYYNGIPFWGQSVINPVLLSNFIPSNKTYNGEWIRYKSSMEEIMRRFIYVRNIKGESSYEVISPYDFFSTSGTQAQLIKSGGCIMMYHDEGHSQYASMTFGLCLGIYDFQPGSNNQHWVKGDISPFTGVIGYNYRDNLLFYNAKLYGKSKFVK